MRTTSIVWLCMSLMIATSDKMCVVSRGVTQVQHSKQSRVPFRYIIFGNEVAQEDDPRNANRFVEVLMEPESFSEENLRRLFDLTSKRFPKPETLKVRVYTSLKQIGTPEERDFRVSEQPSNPNREEYDSAILIRQDDNALIRYTCNEAKTELKTVILKGRDPFGS